MCCHTTCYKGEPVKYLHTISWLKTRVQDNLFPHLKECCNDPLTTIQKDLVMCLEVIEIEKYVSSPYYHWMGRIPEDRRPIARAFVAKATYNLPTTRMLIDMLHTMPNLRMICGFVKKRDIPSESTFSRAFADFAHHDLGRKVHDTLVEEHLSDQLIGHIARDATAIKGNEKPATKEMKKKVPKKRGRPKKEETRPVKDDTRLFLQVAQSPADALLTIPTHCDIGTKKNAQGYKETWRGYKFHVDTTDSGLPVTTLLTSASLHDSQVAIPMMKITSQKVTSLYDLMDSAYDAKEIWDVSRSLGHAPIIERNPRRGVAIPMAPAEALRYHERTASERLNARLKEEFGARHVKVRGHKKVSLHLMFGIIALFADQLIRLSL
jgi:IS5 family transposase